MQNIGESRKITMIHAYQEAGYAIACMRLGINFRSVSILMIKSSLRNQLLKNLKINPEKRFDIKAKSRVINFIVALLAGSISEMKYTKTKTSRFRIPDSELALSILKEINGSSVLAKSHLKYLFKASSSIFRDLDTRKPTRAWDNAEFVAYLISNEQVISFQEIQRAIQLKESMTSGRGGKK